MLTIEILAGGIQTTVQDLGRTGYRAAGVPLSGAMDRLALAAANLLVGNDRGAACLETLLGGLALRFLRPCVISVTGGDLQPEVDGAPLGAWAAARVEQGAVLAFAGRRGGARAYLAVAGGLLVPRVLHSASTYLPGGWGGYHGRALHAGDLLETGANGRGKSNVDRWLPPEHRPGYSSFPTLQCVAGPHQALFPPETLATFFGRSYTLSPASDRMGYRLAGPTLHAAASANLASAGVLPGTVQVPPHGQPILLMADAQSTGGYPIIATVIGADLPLAAQLLPGDRVRFRAVSVSEAVAAARRQHAVLVAIGDEAFFFLFPV
ncbi:MAG: biotin-dependent carboxyltransferase family protein [Chloroflexota bacterium]|nr:biotin-dependent carboxyltransferase family protein [Chloroflexota bacterium]